MQSHGHTYILSLIGDGPIGPAARHGLQSLRRALQAASVSFQEYRTLDAARGDTVLVIGLPGSPAVDEMLRANGIEPPQDAEATLIQRLRWQDKPALVVSGGDDRGLMYALLDVADRIGWAEDAADPLSRVRDAHESPYVAERSLSIYTMHKAHFLRRFHDEAYWARYLDMLARNRFNTFALLFAYESAGLFAPPYPYFFDVPGHPGVYVAGLTEEEQVRNLRSLNRLIAMAHERGLDFTLGIWDHIYRGGVQQGPGQDAASPLPWRVLGLTEDNLVDYSVAALACLLERVPNVDTLQFRMHGESGLTREEMDVFWARIYDVMIERGKGIRFDARAKGFPDHLIDLALEKGIDIRICTKYWMEQMGLPYHPTHVHPQNQMDRRHGYADLLRYPQRYPVVWRLWNGGTARVLLWGDPEYVRRFAASTHLYKGAGFDVNEPLATQMASQDHDAEPFELLRPAYRAHDWEFERYWHFFQLWGRLGYNPQTPSEVWEVEFERRFGAAAPAIERALHLASRVLPRIVACNYPYRLFPTTRGWIEKQRMGDLAEYAAALPSDTQQFLSFGEAAHNQVEGVDSPKIHPLTSAAWFARIADQVLSLVEDAEDQVSNGKDAEFLSTVVDLRILAYLALYHALRCHAGLQYALFERTQDLHALDKAIAHEGRAIEAWEQLVAAAGDAYADDLRMGLRSAGLCGHWRDELAALRQGLAALREQRASFCAPEADEGPWIAHVPIRRATPGQDVVVRATVSGHAPMTRVWVVYGRDGNEVHTLRMKETEPTLYRSVIPGEQVVGGLRYWIEAVDAEGRQAAFPEGEQAQSLSVTVTDDNEPPTVIHEPIRAAPAGRPLTVIAQVHDPSGVRWVRLRYRSVTQFHEFRALDMLPTGRQDEYQGIVPGEHLDPGWDFMYLIEAMDACGNGAIYPDLEVETPYVVVRLKQ